MSSSGGRCVVAPPKDFRPIAVEDLARGVGGQDVEEFRRTGYLWPAIRSLRQPGAPSLDGVAPRASTGITTCQVAGAEPAVAVVVEWCPPLGGRLGRRPRQDGRTRSA
ncbi:hypothetical protein ADK34_31660 [Streptomyces viridochromogenes]|uniref:Uncharacterized protein n=1 Tax=Streptomyces viridochromogenes TaxID=1938 RepID=A0A0L8JFG1_STRVR|nr:hypothetical protein ADK34_31660 [Streptomyces viridochromogenes]